MRRHVLQIAFRVALAIGVAAALPYAHLQWGEAYPGDGQQASGFMLIFVLIGCVAAAVFVAAGSLLQFLLRRRRPAFTVLSDVVLFLAFAGTLAYAGLTAQYSG